MQNVWRNIAGRRLGARSYSSVPRVPDQVPTPELDRMSLFVNGSILVVLLGSAGFYLTDAILYGINYNGIRTRRKAAAAEDEETNRKLQCILAEYRSRKTKMNDEQLERAAVD